MARGLQSLVFDDEGAGRGQNFVLLWVEVEAGLDWFRSSEKLILIVL